MRTRRAKSRTTSRYANVIEHLESRYLLTDLVGDTPATATDLGTLTAAEPLEIFGTIDTAFDLDVFRFQAGTQETATIELSANFSSLDTFVRLLDSSGNELAFDDDSGPGSNSLLRFTVSGGATFFVEAGDFFDGTGDFFLSISLDVGDSIATATDLGLLTAAHPVNFLGTIEQASDHDFFQFETVLAGSATIELSADFSSLDTVVTLFDSSGTQVANNDDFGTSTDSRLTFAVAEGETYFVEARGFGTTVGEYLLNLSLLPDVGDTLATAQDLGVFTEGQRLDVLSVIDQAFDRDVFHFQAGVSGSTLVELSANLGHLDTFVTVLDSFGNVIAFNDDSNISTTNSSLAFEIEQGKDYFVETRGVGSAVGEYQLHVTLVTNLGVLTTAQPIVVLDTIDPAFDRDRFQFQTSVAGLTVVELSADLSFLDTFVTVFDSAGNVIASNDDIELFFNTDSRVTFAAEAGETYSVETRGFGSSVGDYSLRLTLLQDVVGGTIATAQDLGHLTAERPLDFLSLIDQAFDRDVFQFQADLSGSVLVELGADFSVLATLSLNTVVTVFDSAGNVVASNDDIELFNRDSRVVFTAQAGEIYFVEARGFSSSIGGYSLHVAVDMGFPRETATDVGSLTVARPIERSGVIEASESHDLFLFTAATSGTVEVRQTVTSVAAGGVSFDGVLKAFNVNSGVPIANDFGSFDTSVPRVVAFAVVAGQSYFAEVTGFRGSTGDYQVTFNYVVDDVPAAGVDFVFPSRAGSIEVSGDIDTYRFTADTDQTLQISLDGAAGSFLDPILNVRVFASNDLATPLRTFRNDDFGFSFNSFLSIPGVLRGQVIEVDARGFGSSRGRYDLTITSANGNVAATNLVAGTPAFGSIETAFSTDVFRFMATSPGVATIDVTSFDSPELPLGAIGDPLVTIRETFTGNFVAFDDDSGPGLNSLANFTVTAGTQYDVVVGGFGTRTGNYRVTLSTNAADDFGNTFDQANDLSFVNNSLTTTRNGSISPPPSTGPADVDVFSFMAGSNGTLRVSVTPTSPSLQAGLSVFQASPTGNTADVELLDVSGASAPGISTELFVPVSQGRTYFFRVSGLNGSFGDYSLLVEDRNDQVPGEAPGAALLFAGNMGTPANLSGQSVDFPSDRDWYRLVAPASGEFTINLAQAPGSQLDPILTIYNDQGLAIVRNDDNGVSSLNSQLTLQASRANEVFFVEAAGINETTGDYRLTVQFAAAQAADDFGSDVGHSSLIPEGSPGRFAQQGILEATQDRDFFAFTAAVGGSFTVELVTPNGGALPAGVEVQVFEVEASSLSAVSLDNLTRVASITSMGGELALNLPGDNSTIAIQRSQDDLQRTESHFLVAVSNVGTATNVGYNFSINVTPGVASQNLQLQNAALFALLSLADGAAAMGDQNSVAINAAIQAAMNELGKSGNFLVVLLDPVNDPVLTDSAGRQIGFMSNTGALNGVPGGYVSVGSYGQVLIVPFNASLSGTVSLQFAGVGSLGQALSSFSAFVVGPSGSAAVSLRGPSVSDGAKGNFVVQLGFGDGIPTSTSSVSVPGAQSPSFFMMTNVLPNDRQSPSTETQRTEVSDFVRIGDDADDRRDPPEPAFWIAVLEGVLHVLQNGIEDSTILRFEDGLRQSIDRHPERISTIDLPVELLKNTSVGRSAMAMYGVLKHSAGWFRNAKPTPAPAPKQRTPMPKVTQETPSPKNATQARVASKKTTHLGG